MRHSVDRRRTLAVRMMTVACVFGAASCKIDEPTSVVATTKLSAAVALNQAKYDAERATVVPGVFVVHLRKTVSDVETTANALARTYGGTVGAVWTGRRLHGFTLLNAPRESFKPLARDPSVRFVAPMRSANTLSVQSLPPQVYVNGPQYYGYLLDPLWHLDRIDQYGSAAYDSSYDYGATGERGSGVRIYIVDTGVRAGHAEFASGRILSGNCQYHYYLLGLIWSHDVSCSETIDSRD